MNLLMPMTICSLDKEFVIKQLVEKIFNCVIVAILSCPFILCEIKVCD